MQSFRVRTIILVSIGLILGISEFIIVGILSSLANSFHVSVASVGLLTTIFAVVYAISTPIISLLIGDAKLMKVMMIILSVFIFGNLMSALAPNFAVLAVSRVITALVSGITISLTITFATKIAPKEKRAWIVSWIFSGFSIANIIGVPIGTWITGHLGWRYVFALIVVVSTIILISFYISLPHDIQQAKVENFSSQFDILKDRRILLGMTIPALALGSVYVLYTYVTPLLINHYGFNVNFVTGFLVVYGVGTLVSNQLGGVLAAKNGLHRLFKFYVLQMVALACASIFFKVSWINLIIIVILGITIYMSGATSQLLYMEIAENDYPQSLVLASSLNPISSNIGIAVGSATGSVLVNSMGLPVLGFGGAIYAAILLMVIWTLTHKYHQK